MVRCHERSDVPTSRLWFEINKKGANEGRLFLAFDLDEPSR
jgi:hypothetical protein